MATSTNLSSSSTLASSTPIQELVVKGCRFSILERSLRGKLTVWLVLHMLYHAKLKEHGYEAFVCLLRCLLSKLLGTVKLLALCFCIGLIKRHVKEADAEEGRKEEESGEIQEVGHHVTIDVQENQETPSFEEITENVEVKEEETEEEKELLLLKRRSDWWVNTRNIMAMAAIFLATVSLTGSFTPPAKVLDVKVAAILFSVSLHICFMVSSLVLFFLFGVTSTSASIEQRFLQLANLGLWISFFFLTAAYLVNMWVSISYKELKICLTISTCVVFGGLASFLFSAKLRAIFGGVKVLKETDDDVKPYILYEIFKVQEAHVVVDV